MGELLLMCKTFYSYYTDFLETAAAKFNIRSIFSPVPIEWE